MSEHSGSAGGVAAATRKPKVEQPWKHHDRLAQKNGPKGSIYWVGRAIIGEDGSFTGERTKGAQFHGEWADNKKHGYGVQVFPNGEKYEGQWASGLREGDGTLWVPNKKTGKLRKLYVGGWVGDKRHGRGTCFFKSGVFYQGNWNCGKMHGQGTLRYESGDLYVGEFYNGLRSGNGTLNKANGDCYEGWWLEDKREGNGSFFYAASGKVFVGEWANDLPKAGIYTQASQNPEAATAVAQTSVLPAVRLAFPVQVLEGAIANARKARKSMRAQRTPIERLFASEEIESLRGAFVAAHKSTGGKVGAAELGQLCRELGTLVPEDRLRKFMDEATGRGQSDEEYVFTFEDFLRVVAIILDEEPPEPEPSSPMGMDSWDETAVDATADMDAYSEGGYSLEA